MFPGFFSVSGRGRYAGLQIFSGQSGIPQASRASAVRSPRHRETRRHSLPTPVSPGFGANPFAASLSTRFAIAPAELGLTWSKANCSRGEDGPEFRRNRFAMLDAIRNYAERERLGLCSRLLFGRAIRENARQRRHFADPATVFFTCQIDAKHWSLLVQDSPQQGYGKRIWSGRGESNARP